MREIGERNATGPDDRTFTISSARLRSLFFCLCICLFVLLFFRWAHFSELKDENLRRSVSSIRRWNIVAAECRFIAATATTMKDPSRRIRLEHFEDLDESAASDATSSSSPRPIHPSSVCPFLGREAWINYSGRFDPCCAPDEQRKSLGTFGQVNYSNPGVMSLLDIWKSNNYQQLINNYTNKPLCQGCNMRRPPATSTVQ